MSRESLLISIGILIALSPYLGVPFWLLSIVLPILGITVTAFAISMSMRTKRAVENRPAISYESAEA